MNKWLTLHARVKTMLVAVAIFASGQGILVIQGAEDLRTAAGLTAVSFLTAFIGYLAPSETKDA